MKFLYIWRNLFFNNWIWNFKKDRLLPDQSHWAPWQTHSVTWDLCPGPQKRRHKDPWFRPRLFEIEKIIVRNYSLSKIIFNYLLSKLLLYAILELGSHSLEHLSPWQNRRKVSYFTKYKKELKNCLSKIRKRMFKNLLSKVSSWKNYWLSFSTKRNT